MNLENIPTPETDAIYEPKPTGTIEYIGEHKCRDLERRLTIARDTLNRIHTWTTDHAAKSLAKEILTLTAPKS